MDKPRIKPHEQKINFPGEDYTPELPLPDIRLEHFAVLISRNVSKRGAVLQSFPLASPSSASFRASRILQDDKVRDRITYLRRRICAATASETPQEIARAAFAGEAAETIPDGPSDNIGHQIDKSGHDIDNLGHSSDKSGHSEKRRLVYSGDLTPAELRRIIADHARAGNASALSAAIKILDAQMSAPPQVANPAGLCAILFNGGGGGETLPHIVKRLVSIFGLSEIMAEIDRITMQTIETKEDSAERPNATESTLCDDAQRGEQPGGHEAGRQAGSQEDGQEDRQADRQAGRQGGEGGEGGESGAAEEV